MNWNNRYLIKRGERWYYRRRVPEDVAGVLGRSSVKVALKTDSLKEARIRRDALVEADDQYWASLHIDESSNCRYVGTGGTLPVNLNFTGGSYEHSRRKRDQT